MSYVPPQPHEEFVSSRPRLEELPTRRPSSLWDRVKVLLLLVALLGFFVAAEIADNPILPVSEAINETLRSKSWLLVLIGLELLRQVHYLISEHSPRYHQLWTKRVFGGWNAYMSRFNAWNRYRFARAMKWTLAIVVGAIVLGRLLDTSPFTAYFDGLSEALDAAPVIAQAAIFLLFWIGFQFFLMFYFMTRGGVETFFPDDVSTRFSDVWGQDQVKRRVRENLLFLDNPEVIEQRGGYVPGGILLWGPPGTGKTLMAEAMAGETGMPFVNVDASMLGVGIGPLKVILLFRKLRKYALKYGGVVVFFDEADSLGNRGQLAGTQPEGLPAKTPTPFTAARQCGGLSYVSDAGRAALLATPPTPELDDQSRRSRFFMGMGGMGGGGGGILQVLLAQLSGLKKPRGFVNRHVRRALGVKPKPPPKYRLLVVMATNLPEKLDAALLRPGRIDRIYKVGYPSKAGRIRTYEGYLAKIRHSLSADDIDRLATMTPYATGATMKDLVNESLITAIRDGRDVVGWGDVIKAKQLKDLGPPEDVEYIERERHATALHEACHAVVAYRVRHHLVIDMATIEKGGNYLGMVSSIPPEDLFTRWRSDYESDVMVSLASLAGEKMFFSGDSSSGVSGDLASATTIATFMEGYWGMGQTIASHGVTHQVGVGGGGRPGKPGDEKERDILKAGLGQRIEENLNGLFDRTEALITENRLQVLAVTHALETHKTLTGEDVEAVIEARQGPLVDGRVYGTPEFEAVAEAYHMAVVEAHAEHGKVSVPLPRLNGQGEIGGADELAEGIVVDEDPPPRSGSTGNGSETKKDGSKTKGNRTKKNGSKTKGNGAKKHGSKKEASNKSTRKKSAD